MATQTNTYLYHLKVEADRAIADLERWMTTVEAANAQQLRPIGVQGFGGEAMARYLDATTTSQKQLNETVQNGVLRQQQWVDVTKKVTASGKEVEIVNRAVNKEFDNMGVLARETVTHYRDLADGTRVARTEITTHGEAMDRFGRRIDATNNRMLRHMQIIAEAIIAYEIFRRVGQVISEWTEIHREADWQLAMFRISVGENIAVVEQYEQAISRLAFATGTLRPEVGETLAMTRRVGASDELTRRATEVEMLTGVQSTVAVREIFALQQQFPQKSMQEIMDSFASGIRAGTLKPDELFGLSETWGSFARAFRVDLDEIIGLFAGLGTVLGESGGTLEQFMRHLERFYTDPQLSQMTYQMTGVPTSYRTQGGNIERTPITEILQAVALLPYQQREQIRAEFPNQLGQRTQQYFDQMVASMDIIGKAIDTVQEKAITWTDAISIAGDSFEIASRRMKVAWSDLLLAIGGTDTVTKLTNTVAAQIENTARWISGFGEGFRRANPADIMRVNRGEFNTLERMTPGDLGQYIQMMPIPENLSSGQAASLFMKMMGGFIETEAYSRINESIEGGRGSAAQMYIAFNDFAMSEAGQLIAISFINNLVALGYDIATPSILSATREQRWPAMLAVAMQEEARRTPFEQAPTTDNRVPVPPNYFDIASVSMGEELARALRSGLQIEGGLQGAYDEFERQITRNAQAMGYSADVQRETIVITDEFGRAVYTVVANSDILSMALRDLADSVQSAILDLPRISLPEGMTPEILATYYGRASGALSGIAGGRPIGATPQESLIISGGIPVGIGSYDQAIASMAVTQFTNDQRIAREANQEAERRHREIVSFWDRMINELPGLTSATPVTAKQFYETATGTYTDQIDESLRQVRADVNNILGGRPQEYGLLSGELFPDIFTPDIMGYIKGADLDTQKRLLDDLVAEAERQFYGLMRPLEEYDMDAIEAQARNWIKEQETAKANREAIQSELFNRIGPEAMKFLDATTQPPIVTYMTGGKSTEEIQQQIGDMLSIADVTEKSMSDINWASTVYNGINQSIQEDEDTFLAAGQLMGIPLARGAASSFVSAIVPLIIEQVWAQLGTP